MSTIRATPPAPGDRPTWAEYWAEVNSEWHLAAREVCQLADRVQSVAGGYLEWSAGDQQPGDEPWWHADLDWSRLDEDLAAGRTTLSSSEKALARVAVGLVQGRGEIEYLALLSAGYLTDVLDIVRRCAEAIDAGGTRS